MYWIAVSQYQDIIRHAVTEDSEDMASQKAMFFAARRVYRAYAEKAPALANKLDTLPAILYACEDEDIEEMDLDQVQVTVRGEPERAIAMQAVTFRDITLC